MKSKLPRRKWTAEEDTAVINHYGERGSAWLEAHLPGKTRDAIKKRASMLGVATRRRTKWGQEDDDTLRKLYWTNTAAEISTVLNRSPDAILERVRAIGLSKYKKRNTTTSKGQTMKRTIYFNTTTLTMLGDDFEANMSARIAHIAASWAMACDAGGIERDDAEALPSAMVRYRAILDDAMPALAVGEWALLCDALNGSVRSATHRDTDPARTLAQSVEDSGEDGLAEKWGVDIAALAARLRSLPYAGRCAVIETVSRFWAQAGNQLAPIAEQLAAAGAKVASGEDKTT